MPDDYAIHLNFLPVTSTLPATRLFRRKRVSDQEERPVPAATSFKLPEASRVEPQWHSYWIVSEAVDGFDSFTYQPDWQPYLTKRLLFQGLHRAAVESLTANQFRVPDNEFIEELSFVMKEHPEGQELLVVQPYRLRATWQHGLLFDFHFRLNKSVQFNRKIQQLSLSLDRNFRRNLDYYLDRFTKIRTYLNQRRNVIDRLRLPGSDTPVVLSKDFASLKAERLRTKVYVFAGAREARSQFTGLRDYGPLQPLDRPPRLLFVFREQDRHAARVLAAALKGGKQRGQFNFPGFKALFKTDIEIDSNPVVLPDLTAQSMQTALDRVNAGRSTTPNLLPVVVLPNIEENGYLAQKAMFSHAGFPTQVCTLRLLQDDDALKWAIGNLALQIFCKAGGQPWKVRPTAENSLIVGISQSHKTRIVDDERHIDKYFAFSVLTDSSGLFKQIQVLGEANDKPSYINALRQNLKQMLEANAKEFRRVVIHTSFKLKHDEMDAIQATVKEVAEAASNSKCRFAVIKVNHKSRFFGVNRSVNSLVPFEATKVWLGHHEYLVWFEGIFPDKPNVSKAFPGPTHLQFLRLSEDGTDPAEEREMLQDLVNLSGANWRGFNAKSAPVSIFYCHLVADLVHDFHDQGLPLPEVPNIRPWFL